MIVASTYLSFIEHRVKYCIIRKQSVDEHKQTAAKKIPARKVV